MINKEALKYYREKNNWNLKDLAKKVKCSKKIVELWEIGDVDPKEEDLIKLAKIYGIELDDLYIIEEENKLNILLLIVLFILGVLMGILIDNLTLIFLTPFINCLTYIMIFNLGLMEKNDDDGPKSLFGFDLTQKDIKVYFLEANIIACFYTLVNILFRILDFNSLVIDINFNLSKNMSTFIIIMGSYLLLMFLSFIIELIFGKYLLKKYKGVRE